MQAFAPTGECAAERSRTYNVLDADNRLGLAPGATFGQYIGGELDTAAIACGQVATLVGLSQHGNESAGFRSNLGVSSVVAVPISVEIKLFRADGTTVGSMSVDLPPFGYRQINNVFGTVGA